MKLLQGISGILATLDRHPRRCMWGMTLFAVVYYLLISLQGFDFADEGFSLTFYQNIFTHPSDVEYLFLYYLSGLIGGIWEVLFGNWGNYAYRILFALTSGGIVLTTFAILKPYFKTSTIVLSTLACVLYPGLCLHYFNHDCLTALLFLLTVYALTQGMNGKRWAWWSMGLFLALNTFTRTPNITLWILIFIPVIESIHTGNYSKAGHNILRIIGGAFIGKVVVLTIMYLLGHITPFVSAILSLFVMGGDSSDTHSITHLLGNYVRTYKNIISVSIKVFIVCLLYIISIRHIKIKGIGLIVGIISIAFIYSLLSRNFYAMWGGVTAASIIYTLIHHRDTQRLTLGLSALTMLIVIPLGGDSYANICYSCMWLGMPLLINMFRNPIQWNISYNDEYQRSINIHTDKSISRQLSIIAGTAFLLFVALHSNCYFDDGSRLGKLYLAQADQATTFTTQERASIIDDIVTHTSQHRAQGNYLLVFDNLPMLHYLTNMQPYLGSPWSTFWGNKMFEKKLFEAENSSRELPLIAIPHFYYKDLSSTQYLDAQEHPELQEKAKILLEFMQRNSYQEVFHNSHLTLYKVIE